MWTRVVLTAPDAARLEEIAAALVELGAAGCEIRDGDTFSEFDDSRFPRAQGPPRLIAFFPPEANASVLGSLPVRLAGIEVDRVRAP